MMCFEAMDCDGWSGGGYFFGGTFHATDSMGREIKRVSNEIDELSNWLGKSRKDMADIERAAFHEGFTHVDAQIETMRTSKTRREEVSETVKNLYEQEAENKMSRVVGKADNPLPLVVIEKPKDK